MTTPPNDPFSAPPGASLNGQPTEIPPPPGAGGFANSYVPPPPAASAAPAYAQPPQYGGNLPYSSPASSSKNSLGVISLVLGLVGIATGGLTSIAGIVLGHLALSANKKGTADNKGLSIAGLVISYVVTLGAAAIVAVIVIAAVSIPSQASGFDARLDASALGREVATYYIDGDGPAVVTYESGDYYLNGERVEVAYLDQPNVLSTGTTASDWCVSVSPPELDVSWSYSARDGLQSGPPCSGTPLTASDIPENSATLDLGASDADLPYVSLVIGDAWNTGFRVTSCSLNPYEDGADWSALGVPCTEPHYGEIFAIVEFAEGAYPSDELYNRQVDEVCFGQMFEDYVGIPFGESIYSVDWVYPLQDVWESGNRQLVCMVVASDGGNLEDEPFGSGR